MYEVQVSQGSSKTVRNYVWSSVITGIWYKSIMYEIQVSQGSGKTVLCMKFKYPKGLGRQCYVWNLSILGVWEDSVMYEIQVS